MWLFYKYKNMLLIEFNILEKIFSKIEINEYFF